MTEKIIITHDESVTASDALFYVKSVVNDGMVSNGQHGEQYCFVTTFKDKFGGGKGATVYADKTKGGTHTFRVSGEIG